MATFDLNFKPTHQTGGLPGFPAVDLFYDPHTVITAPAACKVVWPHLIPWNIARRVGGLTAYLQFKDRTVFITHLELVAQAGPLLRGAAIGSVAPVPRNAWPAHIHIGRKPGIFTPR